MKSLHELAFNYRNASFKQVDYAWNDLAQYEALMTQFAQALLSNDSSGRCDFCDTGYCYGSHEPDCVIMKAKEFLKGLY